MAQGWVQKGFDADETAFTNAIRAVTMIPAATEWGYAPYEVFQDVTSIGTEIVQTQNGYSVYDSSQWTVGYIGRREGRAHRRGGVRLGHVAE